MTKTLPKELNFLKKLDKFSFEKSFTIKVADSTMEFRVLKTEEQLKVLERSMAKVDVRKDKASFVFELRLNTLAFSLKSIDGEVFPYPETYFDIEGEETPKQMIEYVREHILTWNEWIYSYVITTLEKEQDKVYKEVKDQYGLTFDEVKTPTPFNYDTEFKGIRDDEEALIKQSAGDSPEVAVVPTHEEVKEEPTISPKVKEEPLKTTPNALEKEKSLPTQEDFYNAKNSAPRGGLTATKPMPVTQVKDDPMAFAEHMTNITKSPRIKK